MYITSLRTKLKLHIGVTEEERREPRDVKIKFDLQYRENPNSIRDDNSNDYICYQTILDEVESKIQNQHFKLLEFLCQKITLIIKNKIQDRALLNLEISKTYSQNDGRESKAKCQYKEF